MTNNTRTLGKMRAAALITAAIITLAVFTGCPNAAKPKAPEPPAPAPKHAVSFSVEGMGGTLKAKAEGVAETEMSPIMVEQGKTVTFTAEPNTDYVVKKWTVSGGSFVSGGTENNTTATVKITAETAVKVSFTEYKTVEFGTDGVDLDNYLKNTASGTEVNYIKVSGLRTTDLIATAGNGYRSQLGKILFGNSTKKVALKFAGNITGLTDMSGCFYGCPNLVQAPDIPASVTNMRSCFNACSITKAPKIPEGVTDMSECFMSCSYLKEAPAIPNNVKNMKECFSNCSGLKEAPVIPEGVENMAGCFANCTLTKAPAIPASAENISKCFQLCGYLEEVPAIPVGVKNMEACFQDCYSLKIAPVIPEGVENMWQCFKDCRNLEGVPAIPASVTTMKDCFYGCNKLNGAVLKCNYTNDRSFSNAFSLCDGLKEGGIKVPPTQLETYKTNAGTMGTDADKFAKDE